MARGRRLTPEAQSLLALAGVYFAAAASPGPNVLLVTATAARRGRRAALTVAAGVATGGTLWALLACFGVATALAAEPELRTALEALCGAYLTLLGARMALGWHHAAAGRGHDRDEVTPRALFGAGLATNMTNPKAAAFFAGAMTAVLPADASAPLLLAAVALIAACSLSWHCVLAVAFSSARARERHARAEPVVERIVGLLLVALGSELLVRVAT